ncbi:NTP transferase domain-containing protein [Sphingomonas cynarae]|uniref:NTP transferase domain-containing protein n=1 Tax=Sphingomonas cynarae TaxID=930197 RepID=A0ABP7DJD5_9SPHN
MKAIIIAAGHGSRLLPLTLETPKCLVPVGGRAILDHQLRAIEAAGIEAVTVVGGYRIEQIGEHLAARPGNGGGRLTTELVFNPFWAAGSSIGSVWAARAALTGAFVLMNGDTIFDPAVLAAAVTDARRGVKLVVDRLDAAEPDDMLVAVTDGRVRAVGKGLDPDRATHRSLGIVASTGGGAYADALRAVIGGENGIHAFHHAIVDRLAGVDAVAAVAIPAGAPWQEIDRPDDIERWRRERGS